MVIACVCICRSVKYAIWLYFCQGCCYLYEYELWISIEHLLTFKSGTYKSARCRELTISWVKYIFFIRVVFQLQVSLTDMSPWQGANQSFSGWYWLKKAHSLVFNHLKETVNEKMWTWRWHIGTNEQITPDYCLFAPHSAVLGIQSMSF